jgi:hypothetical protein
MAVAVRYCIRKYVVGIDTVDQYGIVPSKWDSYAGFGTLYRRRDITGDKYHRIVDIFH